MSSLLFALIQFIPLTYFFILKKKNKNLEWYIKHGIYCYSCKEKIMLDEEIAVADFDKEELKICKSCERDETLSQLIGGKKHKSNTIKRFFLTKKADKFTKWILFGGLIIGSIQLLLWFIFKFGHCSFGIANITNTIFWILFIIKFKITSIKKPSEEGL